MAGYRTRRLHKISSDAAEWRATHHNLAGGRTRHGDPKAAARFPEAHPQQSSSDRNVLSKPQRGPDKS